LEEMLEQAFAFSFRKPYHAKRPLSIDKMHINSKELRKKKSDFKNCLWILKWRLPLSRSYCQ